MNDRSLWIRIGAPALVGVLLLALWEAWVRYAELPKYILPTPSDVASTIVAQWPALGPAWVVTLKTMLVALAAAVVLGVALAALFASSRIVETSLFPYAVMLQVTPLVALAPYIVIGLGGENVWFAQLVCAWIIAFFPILSSTSTGLRSVDPGLRDLFNLYRSSPWQRLRLLLAPSALPYFLAGLKVSANLALVGAIVAEFVTGPQAESPGLASTILNSQMSMDTTLMFAALTIVSFTGIVTFFLIQGLGHLMLRRWHESAVGVS